MSTFTAIYINGDSGWIIGYVGEFPAIVVQGKTIEQAQERVRKAAQILLEENREMVRERIDRPVLLRETFTVEVSP